MTEPLLSIRDLRVYYGTSGDRCARSTTCPSTSASAKWWGSSASRAVASRRSVPPRGARAVGEVNLSPFPRFPGRPPAAMTRRTPDVAPSISAETLKQTTKLSDGDIKPSLETLGRMGR